jgi:signal transduction histidine kinase
MLHDIAFGIIISLLFISLVVLFCVVIIKLYIQKIKKYNAVIYENQINFQKTLNTTILETQNQLLQNISQDLHDDAGQQLTVINFQLENLKLDFPDYKLDIISESVANLSQSLRQISHSLNPNWLEKNGLFTAIKTEIIRIQKNNLLTIFSRIPEKTNQDFTNDEQIVLYRIFQEIINNILKHAKASKIEIYITNNPKLELKIIDDGLGFDYQKAISNAQTLGIQNMIKRTEIIDYSIQFLSDIGKGSIIIVSQN